MRLPQALSGWQRQPGGKILLVQVTEGKMHLERRGWEGLTKKWGNEQRKKIKLKSPLTSFGAFALHPGSCKSSVQRVFSNTHSWPRSFSLVFTQQVLLSTQGPEPAPDWEM